MSEHRKAVFQKGNVDNATSLRTKKSEEARKDKRNSVFSTKRKMIMSTDSLSQNELKCIDISSQVTELDRILVLLRHKQLENGIMGLKSLRVFLCLYDQQDTLGSDEHWIL